MSINEQNDCLDGLQLDDPLPPEWLEKRLQKRKLFRALLWSDIEKAEREGDVANWCRRLRRLFAFFPQGLPLTIPVDHSFYEKVAQFQLDRSDNLGADLGMFDGRLCFGRVPLEERPS